VSARFIITAAIASCAVCSVGATLDAQTVRGAVTSAAMPAGAPGVIVLLLDSAQTPRVRALTGDRGEFALRAPAPGSYRLRALRIGLGPAETREFALAADTTIALRMTDVALALPPLTTKEQTQCSAHPDSSLALAALWEDAKTALLATAITPEAGLYRFDLVDHRRSYTFDSGELSSISLAESFIDGDHSWASIPAEELRAHGYLRANGDSTGFGAPGIQTLLSAYFVDTHCFRLARHAPADSLYAIEFEPVRGISHVEVRGRLTILAATRELLALDFSYTNLELPVTGIEAGGHVQFLRLATGGWAITDWAIRIPTFRMKVERRVAAGSPASGRDLPGFRSPALMLDRHEVVPDEMRITGGSLRSVTRGDSTVWTRPTSSIQVQVDSLERGATGTVAWLVGSTRVLPVDSGRSGLFDRLVEGAYLIDVSNRELDVLGWPRRRIRVDVKKPEHVAEHVRLDDALVAARAACADDASRLSASTGVLIGTVTRRGTPAIGQEVAVSWIGDPVGARSPGSLERRLVRTLASDGRFYVCGVPRERPIEIRPSQDDAATTIQLGRDQVVAIVSVKSPR
jgi:hypothetical protein